MGRRGSLLGERDGEPLDPIPVRPHRTLRILALVPTGLTFLLVAIGALVRATGSGDACPDWPRCLGRWVPRLEHHVLIEYSHRFTASLLILAIGVLVVFAWRRYRHSPRVLVPSVVALGLVLVQAGLGGIVVLRRLEALDVTLHLGTAMVLAGTLVVATVGAFSVEARPGRPVAGFTVLARICAGGTLALILVGGLVRGSGAGLAFADWPLMDGRIVPSLAGSDRALQFAHRALALGLGLVIAWVVVRAWREPMKERTVAVLAAVAAALYLAQVLVGASLVWTRLGPASQVAHVTLSSLIWGALVAVASASRPCLASRVDRTPRAGALEPALEAS